MAELAHHRLGRKCSFAGDKMGRMLAVGEHKRERRLGQLLRRAEMNTPCPSLDIAAGSGRSSGN